MRSSIALKALIAALFLWVQGAALLDAAAHGEQPHEHYGISCDLHAVTTEVAPIPVTPQLPLPFRTRIAISQPVLEFRPWSQPPGRAPPPRSPPILQQ
ncbi:hypothetical protein [Henriciella litoralis]|uniref:hypothetical protein n=1 Tax=Henriciella litoralis TaxID=568102 RepID=UPI00111BDD2B|nr:hypothetical protein [Henriciella litoralis]